MEKLAYLSAQINQIVWGEGVILLLLGIGLYFLFGYIAVRCCA